MASVLVIGIGTTGKAVMEEAQKFYYEFTKQNRPGTNTDFLFLETTHASAVKNANGQTAIQQCDITTQNVNASLTNWISANNPEWKWLPTAADLLDSGSGAGGQPVFGRVALWASQTKVRQAIVNAYQHIGGDSSTKIYIVGTFTGGTGTGVFIDVAYLTRQATQNPNIYGMFLLPSDKDVNDPSKSGLCENAYISLKTLDYYYKSGSYSCTLPGGASLSSPFLPFCQVQFYSCDFNNPSASLSLAQLIQTVGFNLVMRILDVTYQATPMQDVIDARVQADYMQKVPKGFFSTIGLNVFQYPEGLLEELFSLEQIKKLLERWADANNYFDNTGTQKTIASLKPALRAESRRYVEELVEDLVTASKGNPVLGSPSMADEVNKHINAIVNKQFRDTEGRYVFSLFDPNNLGNLYSAISGQVGNLRNEIISHLSEKINSISNKYQNINVVEDYLRQFSSGIEELLRYWEKEYKIKGKPEQWTNVCGQYLKGHMVGSRYIYTLMNCGKEWWGELLMNLVNLCYYNALYIELLGIRNTILCAPGTMPFANPNTGEELPNVDSVKRQQSKLLTLLDPQEGNSVICRIGEITSRLSNTNHPQFHYLFNGPTYQSDMNSAMGKYNNNSTHLQLSNITPKLWDYWLDKGDSVSLRDTLLAKVLAFVQGLNLFGNVDVATIMSTLPQSNPQWSKVNNLLNGTQAVIQNDTPAMVRLVNTLQFAPHNCLKTIIVSDQAVGNGIAPKMAGYIPSAAAAAQTYLQLSQMRNTVVVYQEYSYMGALGTNNYQRTFNPLTDVCYQKRIKDSIEKQGENFNKNGLRLAYIDNVALLDNNVNIQ